jgi:hypothetical protein
MAGPIDTTIEAWRRQLDAYRSMTPAERLRLADTMSSDVRSLTLSGIRSRHPEYSAEEQAAELAAILVGPGASPAARRRRPSARTR